LQQAGVLPPRTDYGPDWPTQREATRARDQYRCRQCGAAERPGRQHDVHHIIPFRTFGYIPGQNQAYQVANQLDNLITLCAACHRRVERTQGARGALSGLAYLLRNLAPLHLMCDPGDLGSTVQAHGPQGTQPTVTLYDNAPGGTGLSIALYENHQTLLAAAWDVVRACPCEDGCPACTGPAGETAPQAKDLARRLLEAIIKDINQNAP